MGGTVLYPSTLARMPPARCTMDLEILQGFLKYYIMSNSKMLENRPDDALGSLVETVETVETVQTD